MHLSFAHIACANPGRLINRLCKHWGHKFPVELDDALGRIECVAVRMNPSTWSTPTAACALTAAGPPTVISTWPPSTMVIAGPPPVLCTARIFSLKACRNISTGRCSAP